MKTLRRFSVSKLLLISSMMLTGFISEAVAITIEKPKPDYEAYLGKYDMGEGVNFTLTQDEQHLMGELSGVGTIEIFAEEGTEDTFYAKMAPASFVFQRDKNDEIISLTITIEGKGMMHGRKMP